MSYILDALKRSEQERHQEKVASIDNDMMVMQKRGNQQVLWPYFLGIALLLNAAIFLYFVLDEPHSISNDRSQMQELASEPKNSANTKELPLHLRKPVPSQARLVNNSDKPRTPSLSSDDRETEFTTQGEEIIRPKIGVERRTPSQTQSPPKTEVSDDYTLQISDEAIPVEAEAPAQTGFSSIPLLSEMDISFQRQIPDIQFSSHIYSTEPSARRAMINNLYLREGDGFSGLVLKEIGEFYVLLHKEDKDFKIPVLRDWQSP